MNKPNRCYLLCRYALAFLTLTFFGVKDGSAEDLKQIQNRAFRTCNLIASVQFQGIASWSLGGKWEFDLARDGHKYRVHRTQLTPNMIDGKEVNVDYDTWAFDGKTYQAVNSILSTAKISEKEHALGVNDPILEVYSWLTAWRCRNSDWSALKDTNTWDACFSEATLHGEEVVNGHDCVVIELPQKCVRSECVFHVFLAKSIGYFPVKYERVVKATKELTSVCEVSDLSIQKEPENDIYIPVSVTIEEFGKDHVSLPLKREFRLRENSILLNKPIDHSVFVLTSEETDRIYNVEAVNKEIETQQRNIQEHTQSFDTGSRSRLIIIGINMLVATVALYLIWRKRANAK